MAGNSKKSETMIGAFLLLGLGMLGLIILLFGNIGSLFKDRYEIKVNFTEASGLIEGSTVRLRGAKVGVVAKKPILIGRSQIQVVLAIDEDFRIEEGSVFQISPASILGDKEIQITPPPVSSGGFLEPGDEVAGAAPGGLEYLQSEAEGIAGETRKVIKEAQTALLKIESSVDEIRMVATQLKTTLGKVNDQVLSGRNLESFSGTLANLETASASFVKLGEKLEPAVGDFRMVISEVRETNGVVQAAVRRVEPTLKALPGVVSSIEETAKTATATLKKVDDSEGAIGALVSDDQLKGDMKDFMRNLKERGILRYKDEEAKEDDPRDRFRGRRR